MMIIPAHFGKFRRWWYSKHPIPDAWICPTTGWRHKHRPISGGYGDSRCVNCGQEGYIEYGR